jgi:tetratricopeptide (TPR) repeat protein
MAYGMSAYFGYTPFQDAYLKVQSAAKRALDLDSLLAEPHVALGLMHWFRYWDLTECSRELECAIALNPNDPVAHWAMAIFQASMLADHQRAATEGELALALDPLSILVRSTLCWLSYWARQFDKAIQQCRVTLELNHNIPQAYYVLGAALRAQGNLDEAIATLEQAAAKFRDPLSLAYLGMAYGIDGRRDKARNVFQRLEESCAPHPVRSIFHAFI